MAPSERREQLVDAALSVIVEQGYAGVSIEAIARTAGVTRPVIYDHFPNLGRLLQALVAREGQIALAQVAQVLPGPELTGSPDPVALLGSGVRRFLEAVCSRPSTWRIILLPLDGTPSIIREHVESNRALILDRVQRLLRSTIRDGADDLDVELAARSIMALAEEAGRGALTDPDRLSPARYEAFVRGVMSRLIDGLAPTGPEGAEPRP